MPIITVQRRMAEQGRIRLGQKVATARGGTRPDKLDRFRFTSPNESLIKAIATRYGGEAKAWDNSGKSEWEVITDARSIPVIVVKGGFSQWHEFWTKGGLQHRCDGEKDVTGTFCNPDDPAHREAIAKPTTRLSVMLAEIETLGVWRMESKGWNAAAELPSMAELAMHVGDLVPATLSLAERSSIIDGPKGPQTSRFVVPVLDLNVTKRRLVEIAGGVGGIAGIEESARAALDVAPAPAVEAVVEKVTVDEYVTRADQAQSLADIREVWNDAKAAGALVPALAQILTDRANTFQAETPDPDPDAPVDAELVEDEGGIADPQVDDLWQQILTEAGKRGLSFKDTAADLTESTGHTPASLTVEAATAYLHQLRTGEAAAS